MTQEQELERFKKVNACETLNELADVIESFADKFGVIQGRTKDFDAKRMATACRNYAYHRHNNLTREFGIRQQGLYLLFYMDREVSPTKVEDDFSHRHCSTCNLGQEGSCELELETKCISNTGNEDHGDYWIDVNDDDDEEVVSINSKECENIADNLAIQFAEWCDDNYFRVGNSSIWCESFIFRDSLKFTTKELLIKFKTQLQK